MKRYLFCLQMLFAGDVSTIYDRNDRIVYTDLIKYQMSMDISNIVYKDDFISKVQNAVLTLSKEEKNKIIQGIKQNQTFFRYDTLVNIYDKEMLEGIFVNEEVFLFDEVRVMDLYHKSMQNLVFFPFHDKQRFIDIPKLSIDLKKQIEFSKKFDESSQCAIMMNTHNGEIEALYGNYSYLYNTIDIQDMKSFFDLVDVFYANPNTSKMCVQKTFLHFFEYNSHIGFAEYLTGGYARNQDNKVLSILRNKFNNPVLLGSKELYEDYPSDLDKLNVYYMHLCQALQVLANDGALSPLILSYKDDSSMVSEKALKEFDSDMFFKNFDRYINIDGRHIIAQKGNKLIYVYNNSNQNIQKDMVLNLL